VITAVLDANVLLSGFVHEHGVPGQLLLAWIGRVYRLVISEAILVEVTRGFQKRYFQQRLTPERIANNLALLRRRALLAPITAQVEGVATHPEDDLVLAAAVSAQADYLVTGDDQLLKLGRYQGVQIVSPRTFLNALYS
jgi:uncharacterized protein